MRILFFTPHQLWPINSGARLRNFYLARALAERCQVTLLQIAQPGEQRANDCQSAVFEACLAVNKGRSYTPTSVLKGLIGPTPLTVLNYVSSSVSSTLEKLLQTQQFDSVQLESSHLFSYLRLIRAAPGHPPVLLDWHNIESELMSRYAAETASLPKKLIAYRTSTLLKRLEARLVKGCDFHTVVSQREQHELLKQDPSAQVAVIPNGVDTDAFKARESPEHATNLLFVGSMDYHANIDAVLWFVKTAWPLIAQREPQIRFKIVGRSPSPAVQMLASERVEVTGTVDDVRPFYADSLAVVVPLRVGGGTRLKILEAMAMGVPVISTTLGAEGIDARDGKEILLANSPQDMAVALDRLTSDHGLRQTLVTSARELVDRYYGWTSIGNQLFDIHSKLIGARMSH